MKRTVHSFNASVCFSTLSVRVFVDIASGEQHEDTEIVWGEVRSAEHFHGPNYHSVCRNGAFRLHEVRFGGPGQHHSQSPNQ